MLHHISSHIFPQVKRPTSIQSFHVWRLLQNFDQPFCPPLHLFTLTYQFYHNILLQTFLVSPHLYYSGKKKRVSPLPAPNYLWQNELHRSQHRSSENCTGDLLLWKLVMHFTLFLIFWQIIYFGKSLLLSWICSASLKKPLVKASVKHLTMQIGCYQLQQPQTRCQLTP